jgi:type IV pilus assembly protein PilA
MERMLSKKLSQMRNAEGFTLVELMVVVAIIGILATLAVPQYKKFQAKSRQSEARLSLGGAYTIEQSFAAENASYTLCLGQAGYNRDGVRFYYSVGFSEAAIGADKVCGPNGGLECNNTSWQFLPDSQTYQADTNTSCEPGKQNMGVFMATAGENGKLVPTEVAKAISFMEGAGKDGGNAKGAISQQAFTISAVGSILTAGGAFPLTNEFDGWTIDQNKQLKNTQSGLF